MPTVKPRLNVALSGRTYAAVKSLADAAGVSMSSIVAEHVDAVAPVLERTAQLLVLGKRAQRERLSVVREIVNQAQETMEPLVANAAEVVGSSWDALERELLNVRDGVGGADAATTAAVSVAVAGESVGTVQGPSGRARRSPQRAPASAPEARRGVRPSGGAKRARKAS